MAKIIVQDTEITVVNVQNEDYISLTDMAHNQMKVLEDSGDRRLLK